MAIKTKWRNGIPIDPWTAVHFGVGFVAGRLGIAGPPLLAAGVAYEVWEQSPVGLAAFGAKTSEIPINQVIDVVVLMAGHYIATGAARWV